ncbi:isopropylmalate isomerase large subunit, partial [Actinobacillus minor 202]
AAAVFGKFVDIRNVTLN